jgi:hypothetical protein
MKNEEQRNEEVNTEIMNVEFPILNVEGANYMGEASPVSYIPFIQFIQVSQ